MNRYSAPNHISVLGLGTMGHGIVQVFASAGCCVRAYDVSPTARDVALDRVELNLGEFARAGLIAESEIPVVLERITICETEPVALDGAQFVTEAVREDLDVKQELFARVEEHIHDECILASNTSTYPMTQIAERMRQPERAVNTHWFNPPHIVPLVEVIPGQKTREEVTQTTMELLEQAGKMAVRLNKEMPGFLVNRIQTAMYREIFDLLDRGVASAEDIDRAFCGSIGFRTAAVGPIRVFDFSGIDVSAAVHDELLKEIRSSRQLHEWIEQLVSAGHFGVKTGKGVFEYTPESAQQLQAERDERFLSLLKIFHESPGGP